MKQKKTKTKIKGRKKTVTKLNTKQLTLRGFFYRTSVYMTDAGRPGGIVTRTENALFTVTSYSLSDTSIVRRRQTRQDE